jgi:hypothetical protein
MRKKVYVCCRITLDVVIGLWSLAASLRRERPLQNVDVMSIATKRNMKTAFLIPAGIA